MSFGIKRKILLVLIGSLVATTALHALLASYFTNRQNQDSAFALLRLDLQAWQNELQDLTLQLREAALAAVGDGVMLNHLAELVALEFKLESSAAKQASPETPRTLAYLKSASINRLQLVLRSSGFSSISVYTRGRLSHHVARGAAGLMLRRAGAEDMWLETASDAHGGLPTAAWPAWQPGQPPPPVELTSVAAPTVSFDFSDPRGTVIQVAIPVQGVIEDILTDADVQPKTRFVSHAAIAGRGDSAAAVPHPAPAVFAVVVFRKLIGQADLEKIAARTGKLPALIAPAGPQRQHLTATALPPEEAVQQIRADAPGASPALWQGIVTNGDGSYYAALRTWAFENRPALILSLASSREPTLDNMRQTVAAILTAAGLILLLTLAAGTLLVGRLINPVVALTDAVKAIGVRHRSAAQESGDGRQALEELQPVAIEAPDEVGELTRAFNAMIVELRSALETLEQRVLDRTAELRQQTRYLRTLIDTLPMLVWLKDIESRYLAVNQADAEASGRSVDEMAGKTDFDLWPRELAKAQRADDAAVMASRSRKTVERAIHDGEATTWIETFKAPVLDEDGTVLGLVGAARDISERKAAEAAREAALHEAERLARMRSEFLAQMSHELRTPLNGILGYAQILVRDETLGEKQIEAIKVVQHSGEHLLMLINDILDMAKVEAGKLELYLDTFALRRFVEVIAEIIRVKAEEKELDFHCELAADLPLQVHADERRLRQVLLNLLANAVKFTDRGGVSLRLSCVPPSRVRFEVRDTGTGIAADRLEAIFRPFEQAGESHRRIGGAGLGLAISQQIVELLGGEIRVESRLGEGSLFWFELELPPAPPTAGQEVAKWAVTGYAGPRKTVLVIDDLGENRRLVVDMLSPLGFILVEAASCREGLERTRPVPPDLILIDLVMPEVDGFEATRRLRRQPELAQVPIIAVSASASASDQHNSLAAGANAFLPKPLNRGALLAQLGSLLNLQWTDNAGPTDAPPEDEAGAPLLPPPPAEMDLLHRLARQGSMRELVHQADRLAALDPRYAPFASRLRHLARGYQSKAILKLVEQYLGAGAAD